MTARAATQDAYELAEGALWDPVSKRLHWVDIEAGRVLTGLLHPGGSIEVIRDTLLPGAVGAVATMTEGRLLVAMGGDLAIVGGDGCVVRRRRLLPSGHPGRLNDGKVDPQGRFVVGSHSGGSNSTTELLALIDGPRMAVIDHDLTLSNGLAWSTDGNWFYNVDTFRRTIYRRPWNSWGPAGAREVFATVDDGFPDGITLDADDHLWVAVWAGARVDRLAPNGRRVASIALPVPHVSSVAFAGDGLSTLVVTTAREGLSPIQLAEHPDSGRLFTIEPGVAGVPERPWAGLAAKERTP